MAHSEYIRKLNNLKQLEGRLAPLIVHASDEWHDRILNGECDFIENLGPTAKAQGYRFLLTHFKSDLSYGVRETNHLQISMGPRRLAGNRMYHAYPSYVPGFWYLDKTGYHWNSGVRHMKFKPEQIDFPAAEYFYNGVSGYFTRNNISSRPQSNRKEFNPASAFIPLQNIEKYPKKIHFLTSEQIIRTTCATVPGKVYVKLHPLHNAEERSQWREFCESIPNAEITDASIHDLIAASEIIVSQNSAVGFEAFMYRKPVLTCAECDFHHGTLTCQTTAELAENLRQAKSHFTDFPFEKFFYWFLGQQMLEPQKDEFTELAWKRLLS